MVKHLAGHHMHEHILIVTESFTQLIAQCVNSQTAVVVDRSYNTRIQETGTVL